MAPIWTNEQKKVIELHDRNILVSAAAGSGKTAVLVQRIIEMICDSKHPVDIDRLVIVTFTNAAAYEMRQRIMDEIDKRIEDGMDDVNLRRQQTLINHAQITTIDSFCLNILKNYFGEIDLDPGFRVADEGELKLMMADVMDRLIEDYYERADSDFIDFVECFTPEKTDARLGEYILDLYKAAQSNPWPKEWLLKCKEVYKASDTEKFIKSDVIKYIETEVKKQFKALKSMAEEMLCLINMPGGPYMYAEAVNDDILFINRLIENDNIFDCKDIISNHKYARLSTKKDESVTDDAKNMIKTMRSNIKDNIEKIYNSYMFCDIDTAFGLVKASYRHMNVYIDMAIEFMERFDLEKKKKNIINFNDMEHLALKILVNKDESGNISYTHVADELSARYEEILIDEYQDSNMVQEIILNSVSKERFGNPNVFMVGDVKQSIYRFRLARPELFIEKYNTYSSCDGKYQKIELHNNFRSHENVLKSVNEVFENIMNEELGGIRYDDETRLYAGAVFPERTDELPKTKVFVIEHKKDDGLTDIEAEARVCAAEINKIVNNDRYLCLDKKTGGYRKINYSDIVVLMRSQKRIADELVEVFSQAGIPAISQSKEGYFDSREVSVILSLLNVIDNPLQDIALAAVLKSYFGGFTSSELAKIRIGNKDVSFYEAFMKSTGDKKEAFMGFLEKYRKKAEYMPLNQLIWELVYDTGYYDYIGSMPFGEERQGNVDILMEKAKAYEKTSFHGLFNFVRYIERLKTYDVDYAQASLSGENDDVVRVMTIHKSKGLEFPVVFLCGAGRGLYNSDFGKKTVIDPDLYIGCDYLDSALRVRKKTIIKNAIISKKILDNLSEEQRILYVALTRAKERLYISGCVSNAEDSIKAWSAAAGRKKVTYIDVCRHKNYLDMIMPAALKSESSFNVETILKEAFDRINIVAEKAIAESIDISKEKNRYTFLYPYDTKNNLPAKMTVSELKHMGQEEEDEAVKNLIEEEITPIVPQFISGSEKVHGAERGSAYHKFMEILDYRVCVDRDTVKAYLDECVQNGLISKEWKDAIDISDILKFINSDLGQEMKEAFLKGLLFRERQFVMGITADMVDASYKSDQTVLVQGVIDAYFYTEDGIVLVDYKTDRVPFGNEGMDILTERYSRQLDYYAIALKRLADKDVIKKSIYSFCLGKEIVQ